MENHFIPPQTPRPNDEDVDDTDNIWEFFDDKWNPTMGLCDEIDKSIIVATAIWEDQEFCLSRSKDLAKDYIEKLQRTMKSKLDERVEEENRLKLDPTWTPGPDDEDWLQILHDGLCQNLPNELPEPIQTLLRGEQLPPKDQQAEEASRIVYKLTEGKSVEYIQQLYNNMKGYRGTLSFFQMSPLWGYPGWDKVINKLLYRRGPLEENPMLITSNSWNETFVYVNQRFLQKWASEENGIPFRTQKLLLDQYNPSPWTVVFSGLGRQGFLYTRPQICITTKPQTCTGNENKHPWPAGQEGFPTNVEYRGDQKDKGFGDSQSISGFDLRSEKIFLLQRMNISNFENTQMWPNQGAPRPISYRLDIRLYDTEILREPIVRGPSGLNALKPLFFNLSAYQCDSMAASLLAHFNLLGPMIHDPLNTRYYKRISSNPLNHVFKETEFMRSTPTHFVEDRPYVHRTSGRHEPTMMEVFYDEGFCVSDQILYSRQHSDHKSWEMVRFPNSDYLNVIFLILKPKLNAWSEEFQEEMHVVHVARRIDMLSQLFPPDWRPLKYYQYSFMSSRKNRERCEKRQVFLKVLTQTMEGDMREYYRESLIDPSRSKEEGTSVRFAGNRLKLTRMWMTFCHNNGLYLTNKNENAMVRVNHTMRERDLPKLLIHPGRDVNGVKRPFSMDL